MAGFRFTQIGDVLGPNGYVTPQTAAAATTAPAPTTPTPTPAPAPSAPSSPFGGMMDAVKTDGLGGAFTWLKNKSGARDTPAPGMQYARLEQPARQDLLNAMLQRARGGQPGGAPTTPLPLPNSQTPVA